MNAGVELRSSLLRSQGCSFSAAVTADSGKQMQTFSMDCRADCQGTVTFTVTEPESISGISGTLCADGGKLVFDRTALDFSFLAQDRISPASAPWILLNALRSGNITAACREDAEIRLTVSDGFEEDALKLDIWLDEGNLPVRADVLQGGRRILSLDVRNFEIL